MIVQAPFSWDLLTKSLPATGFEPISRTCVFLTELYFPYLDLYWSASPHMPLATDCSIPRHYLDPDLAYLLSRDESRDDGAREHLGQLDAGRHRGVPGDGFLFGQRPPGRSAEADQREGLHQWEARRDRLHQVLDSVAACHWLLGNMTVWAPRLADYGNVILLPQFVPSHR